jgi:TusA-related sulfurtransferase
MKVDRSLDCLGLYCPEPVFRTRLALDEMEPDEVLKIISDDPAAEEDIQRLVKRLGHKLLQFDKKGDELIFFIKKV